MNGSALLHLCQHQRDVKTGKTAKGFFCHVKENAGHKIDWESVVFVDYEKNWKRTKIKEAIYKRQKK